MPTFLMAYHRERGDTALMHQLPTWIGKCITSVANYPTFLSM